MHSFKWFKKQLNFMALGIAIFFCSTQVFGVEQVKLQLKWTHAFQFAGYYAALHQGYYHEAGLDVEILEGKPGVSVIDEVRSGRAHFGVSTSSLLLTDPIDEVVLLANIFQHSPLVIVALDKGPFHTIHDLDGAVVMLEDGSDELVAYLVNEGLSLDDITFVPHSFSIDNLINGDVDAMSSYLTYEIYEFNQKDVGIKIFTPRSTGIDFYGDNLFTNRAMIEDKPAIAEAFLDASLKGWEYALNNIDETIALIVQHYNPLIDQSFLKYEADSMLQLIRPDLVEIGYVNPGRWQHIAEVYQDLGLLKAEPSWDRFFFTPSEENYTQWITLIMLVSVLTFFIAGIATYIYSVNTRLRKVLIQSQKDHSLKELHNRILAMIADDHPLPTILTEITLSLEAHRPGCLCSIMLKHDDESYLTPIASPSFDTDYIDTIKKVPIAVGAGSCGTAAATRQRVVIADIQSHPYWSSIKDAIVKAGLKSCWSQPVMDHSGQVLATFAIYTKSISEPSSDDIHLIEEVAQLAAIAIDRSRMLELLKLSEQHHRYLAHHDTLTGLANRSLFSDRVDQAIRLAKREGNHLAVVLIDLNDFKLINDQHGHIVGDKLLRAIAKRLKTSIRNSDTISRYGGDEFVILLQGLTDPNEAIVVEQKLYSLMSDPFMIDGLAIMSGCSIGIAYYPEDGLDETALTHAADLRMYTNKRQSK